MSPDPGLCLSKPPAIPCTWGPGFLPGTLWFSFSLRCLSSDPQLCNDLELCDEAMALLDEVIMCTFQQSVYYLTKVCLLFGMASLPVSTVSHCSVVTSYLT